MMSNHTSVLLDACIEGLSILPGGVYIDGTFGRGGHSREILAKLDNGARLIAIDKDPTAIEHANQQFKDADNFQIKHASFADLKRIATEEGILGKVSGILLDLGVSSPQLDEAERGFSFMRNGPLDMRMDTSQGLSAADWLMTADEQEMVMVFKKYGEEKFATRVARAIIQRRLDKPLTTTDELAALVTEAKPVKEKNKHPATKVFQAIRIHINKELEDLETLLNDCLEVLAVGGRLVVISFHSLEDRMVKRFLNAASKPKRVPAGVPVSQAELDKDIRMKVVTKAIKPDDTEIKSNVRARSAVLRIGEKLQ